MNIKTFEFYLFDIEGTTTPIEFVHKILFPYSVEKFDSFFQSNLLEKEWIEKLILEGKNDTTYSGKLSDSAFDLSEYCKHLVSLDRKSGILKEIQGRIWKSGYENGELKSSMFSDVPYFFKKNPSLLKKSLRFILLAVFKRKS